MRRLRERFRAVVRAGRALEKLGWSAAALDLRRRRGPLAQGVLLSRGRDFVTLSLPPAYEASARELGYGSLNERLRFVKRYSSGLDVNADWSRLRRRAGTPAEARRTARPSLSAKAVAGLIDRALKLLDVPSSGWTPKYFCVRKILRRRLEDCGWTVLLDLLYHASGKVELIVQLASDVVGRGVVKRLKASGVFDALGRDLGGFRPNGGPILREGRIVVSYARSDRRQSTLLPDARRISAWRPTRRSLGVSRRTPHNKLREHGIG